MERAAYRILDANFNRAREGLRMQEEYCRFYLCDEGLCSRAKELRHRLSGLLGPIAEAAIAGGRAADADAGKDVVVEGQHTRGDLKDCMKAGAKRLSEALRVLCEIMQTVDAKTAKLLENMRFEAYTLEKDIVRRLPASRFKDAGLYVILTAGADFSLLRMQELCQACCKGGADVIQLRCKGISDACFYSYAQTLVEICGKEGALSIINDRADIAALAGADGVHLGMEDLPADRVRDLFFGPVLIGFTTHCLAEIEQAKNNGCDYIGAGPAFASLTKPDLETGGLAYLRQAVAAVEGMRIGLTAIGGIDLENLQDVLNTGVKTVAAGSAICDSKDPEKMCKQFQEVIKTYRSEV